MGEISDLVLEGVLCECCGGLMEDLCVEGSEELLPGPGHPRLCPDCENDDE